MIRKLLFTILTALTIQSSYAQEVDIFIWEFEDDHINQEKITSAYELIGFTAVNITVGALDSTITTESYDIIIVSEYYDYDIMAGDYVLQSLTSDEVAVVEDFIEAGGHVVWNAENWLTSPVNQEPVDGQENMLNAVNNVFGMALSYGTYFNNMGIGPISIPKVHPSAGPGGIGSINLVGSGSYATLSGVPSLHAAIGADSFDGQNSFDVCEHNVVALFPAQPQFGDGTLITCTEVGTPFASLSNSGFENSIAGLHYALIAQNTILLGAINGWSNNPDNINADCEVGTDIGENLFADLSVYPSPATDVLNIEGRNIGSAVINVMNMLGQKVISVKMTGQIKQTLDVSALKSGMYVVQLIEAGVVKSQPIFID